jgi:hypothetical protein
MATRTKGSTNTTALLTLYTGTKIRGAQWRRAQRFHEYNGVHYGVRLTWPRLGPRLRPTMRLRSDAQRLSTRYRPKPTPRRQTTLCKTLAHAARLPMVRKGAACIPLSSQHSATEKQRGPRRRQRRGLLIISMRAPIQPFENTSISFQDAESRADSGKCSRRTIQLRQFSQPNAFQKESDTHFEMHPSGKG